MKPTTASAISEVTSSADLALIKRGNVIALANGGSAQFTVTTLAGKVVAKKHAAMLDLSNMPNGMYIVNVEANGQHVAQKMVLQ